MQMKKFLMALLCVLLSATTALAQNNVTGTVVDETGEPVIGASVMVKGTKTGTVTDVDGKFSLVNVQGKTPWLFRTSVTTIARLEPRTA